MAVKARPATQNKYFDQPFCGKIIGAIACAATLAAHVLFLVLLQE